MLDRFLEARRADDLVVLEGLEALTHALRFADEVLEVATGDPDDDRKPAPARPRAAPRGRGHRGRPAGQRRPDRGQAPAVRAAARHDDPASANATPTELGRALRVAAAAAVATVFTDQDPWSQAALARLAGACTSRSRSAALDGPLPPGVTLAFGPGTEVATRAGTRLDLPAALAAVLWRR